MSELKFSRFDRAFELTHRQAESHNMPIFHLHNTYEIYYLLSGKREFFIRDRTMEIQAGDVMIVSPHVLHRTTNAAEPQHERLIVNIHRDLMLPRQVEDAGLEVLAPLLGTDYRIIRCSMQERLYTDELARRMIGEVQRREPGFELFLLTLVQQLILFSCRRMTDDKEEPAEYPSPMHERISAVVRYINGHYTEKLSLQLLAEHFFISPYYLSGCFKKATGFTLVEYVNSVRVKESIKLLAETRLPAHLIARKVGFGSVSHFGRVFRQVTGQPPLFYRKLT
ncbi:AraC family transcriptional regulator [Paenibacillus sp. FSL R7-0345]|uniref:AraC family transcriptional regulator n=1 Tax=Paenibacillus sp. FSL R7-0345 TaxID=2954535 RepID=UPI00315A9B64